MVKVALYASLIAKSGKEAEVAEFLKSALPIVQGEPETVTWYAIQEGPDRFSIFDTFEGDGGRDAHLDGDVAKALMARADELFSEPPAIHKMDILASK